MPLKIFQVSFAFIFAFFAGPKDFTGWRLRFSVVIKHLFLKREIDSFVLVLNSRLNHEGIWRDVLKFHLVGWEQYVTI